MQPVEVLLKEYEFLRQEQTAVVRRSDHFLWYGLIVVSLVTAGAFIAAEEAALVSVMVGTLCYGIPFLTSIILLLWVGQEDRRQRVSNYLLTLELDINDTLGKDVLVWENYVRHHKRLAYPAVTVVVLLLSITLGMPLLGQQAAGLAVPTFNMQVAVPWFLGIAVGVFALLRFFRSREQAAIPRERLPWEDEAPARQTAYAEEV